MSNLSRMFSAKFSALMRQGSSLSSDSPMSARNSRKKEEKERKKLEMKSQIEGVKTDENNGGIKSQCETPRSEAGWFRIPKTSAKKTVEPVQEEEVPNKKGVEASAKATDASAKAADVSPVSTAASPTAAVTPTSAASPTVATTLAPAPSIEVAASSSAPPPLPPKTRNIENWLDEVMAVTAKAWDTLVVRSGDSERDTVTDALKESGCPGSLVQKLKLLQSDRKEADDIIRLRCKARYGAMTFRQIPNRKYKMYAALCWDNEGEMDGEDYPGRVFLFDAKK